MPRQCWTAVGLILVGIGFVGYVLPGLPGTVFLILALGAFKKGSPEMEAWLLNHKWFGPTLRDFDENKWISARVKWIACSAIVIFCGGSLFSIKVVWAQIFVAALGVVGVAYILTRKTKPAELSNKNRQCPVSKLEHKDVAEQSKSSVN